MVSQYGVSGLRFKDRAHLLVPASRNLGMYQGLRSPRQENYKQQDLPIVSKERRNESPSWSKVYGSRFNIPVLLIYLPTTGKQKAGASVM